MAAAASSPADVINLALRRIGYRLRVGNLLDGSEAASQALDIYAQTRDELLRQSDWGFAERNTALTVLKSAPAGGYFPPNLWSSAYPPLPWSYAYDYPEDCLKVRAVKPSPLFLLDPDPLPILFDPANDYVDTGEDTLATISVNAAGTGVYTPGDIIQLAGGVALRPARVIVASTKVVSATVAAGGSGGTPGTQTVTGTTGTGTKFQASVTVSGGGAVTAVLSITVAGAYTVNPSAPSAEPVTGASLTGAQLNLQLGVLTVTVSDGGRFTTTATSFTQSGTDGDGLGATFNAATFTAVQSYRRVILANVQDALCVYTARVTDPSDWDPDFTEALAAALGRRLAPVLVDANLIQAASVDEANAKAVAEREQG